jgi:hypothetical protein
MLYTWGTIPEDDVDKQGEKRAGLVQISCSID